MENNARQQHRWGRTHSDIRDIDRYNAYNNMVNADMHNMMMQNKTDVQAHTGQGEGEGEGGGQKREIVTDK